MALNLQTLTGNLNTLTGNRLTRARLRVAIAQPDWGDSGDIYVPQYVETETDPDTGDFSLQLQSTESLVGGAPYTLDMQYLDAFTNRQKTFRVGKFRVPVTGGPHLLTDYLTTDDVPARVFNTVRAFSSWTEFVTKQLTITVGAIAIVGSLAWVRDGGDTISALPGFSPSGPAFVDHYGENAAPGTTDMTVPLREALAGNEVVHMQASRYRITQNIRTYARNGKVLRGAGLLLTTIVVDSGNYNAITFFTGETNAEGTPLSCNGVEIYDLNFNNSGSQRTGGWMINFEERPIKSRIENVQVDNAFNGIDMPAAALCHIKQVYIEGSLRTTTGGTALRFTSDEDAGLYDPDTDRGAKPTDVHVYGLQINQQNSLIDDPYSEAIYIGCADGLYFTSCHIRGATDSVIFETAEAPNRIVLASVDFRQCYFDQVRGSHVVFKGYGNGHTFTQAGGTVTVECKFRSITFEGCRFRSAQGVQGSITFSNMTEGRVERVSIRGGQIRDNWYSGIRDAAANINGGVMGLTVEGVEFSGNNVVDIEGVLGSATHGDIYVRDNRHDIQGNVVKIGDRSSDVGYNIRLLIGTDGESVVTGNNLVSSPITDPARRINYPATAYCYNNPGYRQRADGQVTITNPAQEVIVTHGLAETPRLVQPTLRNDGAGVTRVFADSFTATTFRLRCNAVPTTSIALAWEAVSERRA